MINSIQWEYIFNTKLAIESFPYVIKGIGYTLLISFVSMFAGTVIGLFISLARMSKLALLRWPAKLYISFMRGVPILVILFILYFGFPYIGIEFSAVTAALIGFSLNSAAYIAEINRSAISSVERTVGSRILAGSFLLADDEGHHFAAIDTYCAASACQCIARLDQGVLSRCDDYSAGIAPACENHRGQRV